MIRKHFAGFAASALALAVSAQAFAGTVTTDGADLVIKTKGGLEVATTDKEFSFKLGGRLQADYSQFDGFYTADGGSQDAAYFRRAFLELSGTAYKDWKYLMSYDFAHNAGSSDDGYFDEASITYTGFKPVEIRFGRFDPIFGLEKATSSKWVTAPERNAVYDLMDWTNSHQNGMGIEVAGTYADSLLGAVTLSSKDNSDDNGQSTKQLNLRGVFAPMHEAGNVLHVGLNYAQRNADDEGYDGRFRSRMGMRGVATEGGTEANSGNRAAFGGFNNAAAGDFDKDIAWGVEAAWATGPFSLQGEYMQRTLEAGDNAGVTEDIDADGFYVQAAYTLTGEARGYKLGKFDAIKPQNKQTGAWEVFYRYDDFTVEDENTKGSLTQGVAIRELGEVDGKTHNLGVNWYVNEAVKLSATYVKVKTDGITNDAGDDDGDGFVVRGQYVF
ncbi:OprO/OprP family phosphate-selective porin [Pseudomonas oligotrophica]|uniref:OprO/OprP family phosphate-selective porin n=1 Tax=Pseudomonas oligotrophica TaxID=2912055 RepID=UPI001EFF35B9|nr:porin [Pseudomonas oligotrophica]MCF7202133.1 porin [Pseudomonas oligotrophica]